MRLKFRINYKGPKKYNNSQNHTFQEIERKNYDRINQKLGIFEEKFRMSEKMFKNGPKLEKKFQNIEKIENAFRMPENCPK